MTRTLTPASVLTEAWALSRARRERFTACIGAIADGGRTADATAAALAAHLAATTAAELPLAAQPIWHDRIVRPLKADAAKPLPARAIAAIRSWPSARVGELAHALALIEAILLDAENEAHNEVIYAEISRAYS